MIQFLGSLKYNIGDYKIIILSTEGCGDWTTLSLHIQHNASRDLALLHAFVHPEK